MRVLETILIIAAALIVATIALKLLALAVAVAFGLIPILILAAALYLAFLLVRSATRRGPSI